MLSRRNTTKILAALALIALGLPMVGCKKDKGDKDTASKVGSSTGKMEDGTQKKVLNYFRTTDYKSLDPPKQFDSVSMEIVTNVYDTLLQYHYLKRPYQLAPNLLTKMPELSDDKLTYTFTLRKGVKFHDDACFKDGKGRELTADDVLYSIKRFSDININVKSYGVLLQGRIEGLDAYRDKTKGDEKFDHLKGEVSGLKKVDSHTFTIKLVKVDPLALMPFASGALAIIPHEAVAKYGRELDHKAVGTGPFILKENPRQGKIVLVKNANYHMVYPSDGDPGDKEAGLLAAAGKKLPFVDEVHMPLIEETQPRMLKFRKGEIDWIGIDKDNYSKMAYRDEKGFHLTDEYAAKFGLYTVQSLVATYYTINQKDELLGKNKKLRQALAYAIDVPGFIERLRNGRGYPMSTIVPLPISGNEKAISFEYYKTDIEKAKALLAEAGYPEGKGLPEITIEYGNTTAQTQQDFEFLRAQMAKAGIKVKGEFQTFTTFLGKTEAGNFQIAGGGWQADYPDPENFYQLLYGPNKAPGPNAGAYDNPEYNKLYEQMKAMEPGAERNAIIEKMAAIIKEDVPVILNWTPTVLGLHQKWLHNMKRNLMDDAHFKYLDVDPAAKAKGLPK